MPFDTKKTLEAWKKAKPLLLLDAGVSALLRGLPEHPSIKQLGIFREAQQKLESFMVNPRIQAEKKALTCLMAIHSDIGKYLMQIESDRRHALEDMKRVLAASLNFSVQLEKQTFTCETAFQAALAFAEMRKGLSLEERIQDLAAVPRDIFVEWNSGEEKMMETIQQVLRLLEDAERPEPHVDTKRLLQENTNLFRRCYHLMERAYKTLKGLEGAAFG